MVALSYKFVIIWLNILLKIVTLTIAVGYSLWPVPILKKDINSCAHSK